MEPKNPIIINGVDVSECKYITYRSRLHPKCGNTCTRCYYRKNCYYKQLQRKEKENQRYEQALTVIEDIAKEQMPYLNIDKSKTMIEIEYDYAGKIYILEQRMNKILQKISEVLDE